MTSDAGDTQSLPPRPIEVLQSTVESIAERSQAAVESLDQANARASAIAESLDHANARHAALDGAVAEATGRIEAATVAIATASASLENGVVGVENAARKAQRLSDQLAADGTVEASTGRMLALQQGPAWVLGVGVLVLAFYLVYARIGSPGPWIAVAVGLIMAVALTFRTRLTLGSPHTTARPDPRTDRSS